MLGQAVVDAARKYIGIREATGRNDGDPAELFNRGDEVAWCASFAMRACADAGLPLPGNYWLNRRVSTLIESCADAGIAMGWRIIPQPGDLIFFEPDDEGTSGHVGIVEAVRGHEIHTIEGNTSNMVARRSYPIGDERIQGYARPTPEVV